MMMNAYPETYVHKAQTVLGDCFDYAVNVCSYDPDDFLSVFVSSNIGRCMESGNPKYVVGMSGIELLMSIIHEATGKYVDIAAVDRFFRSPQYWIGWATAYYQWYSAKTYKEIFSALPYSSLLAVYPTLHEADISKFVDVCDAVIERQHKETHLKTVRKARGLTQAELARKSGVSLRSIQLYEQRVKDINKASCISIFNLAKVLSCDIEYLLEK